MTTTDQDDQDAFGHEIFDSFRGKDAFEIIERDDGYIDCTKSPRMYLAEYPDWPEQEKEAMAYVRGRVLDIGCGAGRHCLYLQSRGHDVLGIDTSPLAIEVCRLRGVKNVRVMSITKLGSKLGAFDTILMLGYNFGLFDNPKRARWLLKRLHAMTSPGARIIAGSNNPYKTDNPYHKQYQEWNKRRGRMPGQLRIRVRYRTHATGWFDYLIVSPEEMEGILDGTRWHIGQLIESPGSLFIAIIGKHPSP